MSGIIIHNVAKMFHILRFCSHLKSARAIQYLAVLAHVYPYISEIRLTQCAKRSLKEPSSIGIDSIQWTNGCGIEAGFA